MRDTTLKVTRGIKTSGIVRTDADEKSKTYLQQHKLCLFTHIENDPF